jgi:hypothetical protein
VKFADLYFSANNEDMLLVMAGIALVFVPADPNEEKVVISWPDMIKKKSDPRVAAFLAHVAPIEKSTVVDGRTSRLSDVNAQLKLYQKKLGPQPADTNGGVVGLDKK